MGYIWGDNLTTMCEEKETQIPKSSPRVERLEGRTGLGSTEFYGSK